MLAFVRREPSATLLAVQLAGILLYPFMEGYDAGRALFSLFGILVLSLVVLAVRSLPGLTWVALLLGADLVLSSLAAARRPTRLGLLALTMTALALRRALGPGANAPMGLPADATARRRDLDGGDR